MKQINIKNYLTSIILYGISNGTDESNLTKDYSAINYYIKAFIFSGWVNNKLDIPDLVISNANNPEDENSAFNTRRKTVIEEAIRKNLQIAISSYSVNSSYNFELPVFTYEDWEQILSNVSMTVFVQGMPIGLKYYNNYAIAVSSNNNEYVNPDEIYYTVDNDIYYHKKYCNKISSPISSSTSGVQDDMLGYKNTDFIPKNITNENYNYLKHAQDNTKMQSCYYCLQSPLQNTLEKTSAMGEKYTRSYLHAIARERNVLTK